MKKTLLITLEYPPSLGGVATYLWELHHELPNVFILREKFWKLWPHWLPMVWRAQKEIKNKNIEALSISHVLPVGYIALWFWWTRRLPYTVFVHGLDILRASKSVWKRAWLGIILQNAASVVANSNFTKEVAIKFGAKEKKAVVIYPCLGKVPELEAAAQTGGDRILLSVGRLVERKNNLGVIECLGELLKTFTDIKYVIAGDGPFREKLEKRVKELGLENKVDFVGKVSEDELGNLYKKAELFVLPTISKDDDVEGFGIVFLEAAGYGKPVIAGAGGGVSEAVLDNVTGLVVDPADTNEIKRAISRLLNDREFAKKLGNAGRQRVIKEFSCQNRKSEIEKIYS